MSTPNGLLVVDKPAGITSHDAVVAVRRHVRGVRVGHAGTLDPAATGILLVLLGRSTKLTPLLVEESKEYRAVVRLGRRTDTGDADGRTLFEHEGALPEEGAVRSALARFEGESLQVPPMVSALKVGGRRLYEIARMGGVVERAPRRIRIDRAQLLDWTPPLATVVVACGRGTYIRTLAEDLGAALGVGGSLDSLRRTRVGRFGEDAALPLAEWERLLAAGEWEERLVGIEEALSHLPEFVVSERERPRLLAGRPSPASEIVAVAPGVRAGEMVRVLDPGGRLLALARAVVGADALGGEAAVSPFRLERVLADRAGDPS